MRIPRIVAALGLCALTLAPAGGIPARAQGEGVDFDIPNGHFFTQTSGQTQTSASAASFVGFAVEDDANARFWGEFRRLGGVPGVGYPVSQRFVWDGFVSQAFQKGVFQWRPEAGQAYFVNVFDQMSAAGKDPFLLTVRQVPGIANWSADTGKPFDQVVADHQALLEANAAIKAAYFAVADPVNLYGLPMAPITDMGNVWVLRAQRVVIQQWKEAVPWAAAGEVTVANGGDVAKEAGLLPATAIVPVNFVAGQGVQPAAGLPSASPTPAATALPSPSPTPAPPASPTANPSGGAPAPTGAPNTNPRELRVSASIDNPTTNVGSTVTIRVTVTDESGRPIQDAAVAVVISFPELDFSEFMPNTNAQGQTSLRVPDPERARGPTSTVHLYVIYAQLGVTQDLTLTVR